VQVDFEQALAAVRPDQFRRRFGRAVRGTVHSYSKHGGGPARRGGEPASGSTCPLDAPRTARSNRRVAPCRQRRTATCGSRGSKPRIRGLLALRKTPSVRRLGALDACGWERVEAMKAQASKRPTPRLTLHRADAVWRIRFIAGKVARASCERTPSGQAGTVPPFARCGWPTRSLKRRSAAKGRRADG
jgi:hypothetical protein